jgi:hypothetical protein
MKKVVLALVLLCGFFSANSAFAYDWYNHYDHNHDGRWDRHEYYEAQKNWALTHRGYPASAWNGHFNRYDRNHDHYWDRHEAWKYHHW